MAKKRRIVFFCAHNDDQVIGAGGTIAKYAEEGKEVVTVIFSYGEKSHAWMKPEHIISTRIKEAEACNKILNGSDIIFFDLKEGSFMKQYEELELYDKIKEIIDKYKPEKIFYHGVDDPHPDHQAVHKMINDVLDRTEDEIDAYTFDVWTPINLRKRNTPKMVVDITKTFKKKIKSFKVHKSQKSAIISLLWSVYVKAYLYGLQYGYKYAEVFYKVR
jgi:LmbE family N-acetylglucosaminyl deacetylase